MFPASQQREEKQTRAALQAMQQLKGKLRVSHSDGIKGSGDAIIVATT